MSYLDYEKLETIDPAQFQQAKPYPWLNPAGILTETGYQRLLANLPDREHRMVEPVYKARRPKTSPLYQSISDHFTELESVYEERYQRRYGVLRDVVREVVYKYRGCGDLRKGFARIKCKECKHEVLLAFSCEGRYFCPESLEISSATSAATTA